MNSFDANAQRAKLNALRGKFTKQPNQLQKSSDKALFKAKLNQPQIVRIVPTADGEIPIQELKFYFNLGVTEKVGDRNYNINVLSPSCYGESDPIEMFAEMFTTENSEEYKNMNPEIKSKLLYKLRSQSKYYLPVIIRNQEAQGIKYWGVTEKLLQSILDNMEKDGHLIYDPVNGRDMKVWIEDMGSYKQTKFELGMVKPLSDDASAVESLMNKDSHPKLVDQFSKKEFNELQTILYQVLEPYSEKKTEEPKQEDTGRDYTAVHNSAPEVETTEEVKEEVKVEEDPFGDLPF